MTTTNFPGNLGPYEFVLTNERFTGTLSSGPSLNPGRLNDDAAVCSTTLSGTYPYMTSQFTPTVTGDYTYFDLGDYLETGINVWIAIYDGVSFDPSNPTANGCAANFDDLGTVPLLAGHTYTIVVAAHYAGDTGSYGYLLLAPPTTAIVNTSPTGLGITVDGTSFTAPQNFNWTTGSNHTIATTSPQTGTGTKYVFQSWSDAGAMSHSVTAPGSVTMYTASFQTRYYLKTEVDPSGQGSISPASGYFDSGSSVNVVAASGGNGQTFTGFSGDLSGTADPQSLLMDSPKSVTAHFASVTAIPTLDRLGIAALAVLLAILGLVAVKRGGA